jgi:hypothetical protein
LFPVLKCSGKFVEILSLFPVSVSSVTLVLSRFLVSSIYVYPDTSLMKEEREEEEEKEEEEGEEYE